MILCLVLAVSAATAAGESKRPITIDDIVHMRSVGNPQISPDGTRILYVVRAWEWPGDKVEPDKASKPPDMKSHVWMVPTTGNERERQITFGEKGETSPAWSPDGRFISFTTARAGSGDGEGSKAQVWVMRSEGGEAWPLTEATEGVGWYFWAPDGKQIAYLMQEPLPKDVEQQRKRKDDEEVFEGDFRMTHLWTLDVESKKATQVTSGSDFTVRRLSWSPDGTRIALAVVPTPLVHDEREDVYVVTLATRAIDRIAATSARETSPSWSPDGATIAFISTPGPKKPDADGISVSPLGNPHLMLYDVATRQTRDAYDPKFDHYLQYLVFSPVWTPDGKRLLFDLRYRVYRDIFAYDLAANHYVQVTKGGSVINLGSMSKDGSRVAISVESATAPPDIYVTDASLASPRKLTNSNPQAAEFALGRTEIINWKSSDGWEVEGLLITPVGYQAGKRYPLLVEVHGGPIHAETNGFRVRTGQFWAGQGWAVLYPNFRGSSGYGERFLRGNVSDWGGGDYRDIMAGVDAVIQRGIADPEKLAVTGWSFGGYMTCWIVTQTSRFKAARAGAAMSDIYSFYGTTDIPGYVRTYFNDSSMRASLPRYMERSGITHADKVTTPLLIMHGSGDGRVPIGQPMEFYRALKDHGKTVELVFYPREDHNFGEYYHQRDQLRRDFEWITKYTLGERPAREY